MGTICVSAFALAVVPPGSTHRPHMYPTPGRRGEWGWSEDALEQYRPPQLNTNAIIGTLNILAANVLTQIVPNLSSLYTLFYSVIYNSVGLGKNTISFDRKKTKLIKIPLLNFVTPHLRFRQKHN